MNWGLWIFVGLGFVFYLYWFYILSTLQRTVGPSSPSTDPSRKQIKLHHYFEAQEGMSAVVR